MAYFLFTSRVGRYRLITADRSETSLPPHPDHPNDNWVFAHVHPLMHNEVGLGYAHSDAISAISDRGYFIC